MRVIRRSLVGALGSAAFLFGGCALAQQPSYSDVPDRYRLEIGGFHIGADTNLTFSAGTGTSSPVDFESLDVPNGTNRFYVEGFFRPWRRHQFSVSWYGNNREGDSRTASNDFTWGDVVIGAGAVAQAHVGSDYLSGVYRFAAYKNDRFEIGPSVGVGYLSLEAGIRGEATATLAGVTGSLPFDVSKDLGQPTGDLGGYFYWWPARRLLVRGDLRYILVKPEDAEASVTDGRAAAVYHPWRNFGIGLQYTYSKFRYDRAVRSTELGGTLRYSGGQIVVSGAF